MAITATISGSVGAGVGSFEVYFDSPCYSGSYGGPVTGSTFGTASLYSGSQIESVGGLSIDFPDNAQVAYIRTIGYSVNNDTTGSQYCSQCFGPVTIPNANAPTPTPTPTSTNTPTPTPTNTPTPTPQPSSQVILTAFKMFANEVSSTWQGLSTVDAYCDQNYLVSVTFYTNAPSYAALINTTGYRVYDNSSGNATSFNSSIDKFAVGSSTYGTQNVDEFKVLELTANGTVVAVTNKTCTELPTEPPNGGGEEQ